MKAGIDDVIVVSVDDVGCICRYIALNKVLWYRAAIVSLMIALSLVVCICVGI